MNEIDLTKLEYNEIYIYGQLYGRIYGQLYGSRRAIYKLLSNIMEDEMNPYRDEYNSDGEYLYQQRINTSKAIRELITSDVRGNIDLFMRIFESTFEKEFNHVICEKTTMDSSRLDAIKSIEEQEEYLRGFHHGRSVSSDAAKKFFYKIRGKVDYTYYDVTYKYDYSYINGYIAQLLTLAEYDKLMQIEDHTYKDDDPYILGVRDGFLTEFNFLVYVNSINTIFDNRLEYMGVVRW